MLDSLDNVQLKTFLLGWVGGIPSSAQGLHLALLSGIQEIPGRLRGPYRFDLGIKPRSASCETQLLAPAPGEVF